MASKVFIDANLILDLSLQRENYEAARNILQYGINGRIKLFTTPSIIHITAYWVNKAYGANRTKQLLLALLNDVQVIDCNHETTLLALNSNMDDIEDALQYYTALKFDMEYFISADRKLKKLSIPQLPVYTSQELLKELN